MIPISARHTFSKNDRDTDTILPQDSECWQSLRPSVLGQLSSPPSPTTAPSLISACCSRVSSQLPPSSPLLYPSSGYTALEVFQSVFRQRMGNEEESAGSREGSMMKGKESVSCQNSKTVQIAHFYPVNRAANLAEETHLKTCKSAQWHCQISFLM